MIFTGSEATDNVQLTGVEKRSPSLMLLMGRGRLPCLCFSVIDRSLFIVASILNPVHLLPVVTNLYRNIDMR